MQVSELFNLINTKLPTAGAAHYNAIYAPSRHVCYFSPPGDEYYSIIKNDTEYNIQPIDSSSDKIAIEYHTPTHYYTLNNIFTDTTIEMHNQFRTIMNASDITVPTCTTHEIVEEDGEQWIYNVWQKPFTGCHNITEDVFSGDPTATINTACTKIVEILNILGNAPQGTKIWPKIANTKCLSVENFFKNDNNDWFIKSPLEYTNGYNIDATDYAISSSAFINVYTQLTSTNLHLHTNISGVKNYLTNLNADVFDVAQVMESQNA